MRTTTTAAFVASLLMVAAIAFSQRSAVEYEIRFDNRDHHEAEVQVTFRDVDRDVLELRMSRSSPGRYALHEFAKNVYRLGAVDGRGEPLVVTRPNPHQWNVSGHDGTVRVEYTIFGDRSDGTYLAVDSTHAHINAPATFLWARGLEDRPVRVQIIPPENWKVATQLAPSSAPNVYTAPSFQYFMDSPVEVSDHQRVTFTVGSSDQTYEVRLAVHHEGTPAEAEAYAKLAEAIVLEQAAVYGGFPAFDFGTYTFLIDYLPYVNGDGMEHRNSTVLSSRASLDTPLRVIGTVAHEFFHAWNIERIRPRSLEPFDFERANMSGELWFGEGFTSYYDDLTLKRAGIINLDRYARYISGSLSDIITAPGRKIFSPVEMSQRAPFVDAAEWNDPTNLENTFASYYPYGAVLALGLDLMVRQQYPGRSLDDFMRHVWEKHGVPEVPFTNEDLRDRLGEALDDKDFAHAFFGRHVFDGQLPDFEPLLAQAGLVLRRARPDEAWLGIALRESGGQLIATSSLVGSPAYEAGIDREDVLLELGDQTVTTSEGLRAILEDREPGELVELVFEKRGAIRKASVVLQSHPALEVVPFEHVGRELTAEILSFRESWLGRKSETPLPELEGHCPACRRSYSFDAEFCRYDGERLRLTPEAPAR